ncbi:MULTISPECIES: class I SAM-dependent RNA methyltransferase [unclassified Sphingobium]|uniref:class I SAM-dependent RNA methyltransferase n=1 Tax=unclassified Sphingobium TaxID=2611147 RepID=UPI000D154221|nr:MULTISPECIES: class I SAM-dependent RNA methyltransferase [unclassified Sphingobium]MBG6116683.1 23S rRNA (uracil1939-C5)-methyltransferase [Sphingobium sp. JAI105]PSO13007.1 RNA methyltransferase [Sphingobium sp. AEW4]TWD07129.1 23S rRNA m(5)U-1939 methyltransferase [Sphingobium sp. AEW010]TWD24422.1 23S rRNA m(5)U-1939 methyltransferase [Sphingobium sp. AEW013]TWD26253.1 23S rRNA m(5)U-1939 methyltransferase [Sphingobium sp. AEW001]
MTDTDPDIIIRIAAKGDGLTTDGRHAALTAPGDRLLTDGTIIAGPHRVEPPCVHFPTCGGCELQHVDEASLADFVTGRVVGALAGQGIVAQTVVSPHLSPPMTRRRASLRAVRAGKTVTIGFAESGSHKLIDLSMCAVLDPRLFALLAPLHELLRLILPDKRAAHVRMSLIDQGVDLLLEGVKVEGLAADEGLGDFARTQGLARLTIDEGDGPQTRWEPEAATVTFGGVPVAFPPFSFLQATPDGEAALVGAVREAMPDTGAVADLFCGLGTFALALGADRPVYAAEGARDVVLALKLAGQRAQRRMVADHRDLFRRPLMPEELNRFAAVVIDPPRAGAREQVMQLAASSVPVIAYVSCNPASFARDAVHLVGGGYRLDQVRPVGQFRWSTHVEMVGIFRR